MDVLLLSNMVFKALDQPLHGLHYLGRGLKGGLAVYVRLHDGVRELKGAHKRHVANVLFDIKQ